MTAWQALAIAVGAVVGGWVGTLAVLATLIEMDARRRRKAGRR